MILFVDAYLRKRNTARIEQLNGHIIVCGATFVGSSADHFYDEARELAQQGIHFVNVVIQNLRDEGT